MTVLVGFLVGLLVLELLAAVVAVVWIVAFFGFLRCEAVISAALRGWRTGVETVRG